MTQYVICALQMEGFHCWPEADGELAYLKNSHRHIFFITAEFPVHNANREIEIISQQNQSVPERPHRTAAIRGEDHYRGQGAGADR